MARCKNCGEVVADSDICYGYCVDCFDYEKIEADRKKAEEEAKEKEDPPSLINAWQKTEAIGRLNRDERRLASKNRRKHKH